ncbi:DUF4393 domain-containing protein [Planctomycetales bacterium ZRK34]|nr:DUF4393 domain-containing protein [Planctomycetales bacterium ZRK34]
MAADDKSVDLTGIGKAMQAIPESSWAIVVSTACNTFESILAPITETTGGIGRLIRAKFDHMIDVEKVLAVEAVASADCKAKRATKNPQFPRPNIFIQVLEHASQETDAGIRELWSNLLAQEMVDHSAHPEFGRILTRMTSDDARVLAEIAGRRPTSLSAAFSEAMRRAFAATPLGIVLASRDPRTFNHFHLKNLGLIYHEDGFWDLTTIGRAFIKAVSDPELTVDVPAEH